MRAGVPLTVALIIGAMSGLAATAGAQDLGVVCDTDSDAAITAAGSSGFAAKPFADADGLRQQFGQADRDGDGRISRDEWLQWFGPAYAGDEELMAGTD